MKYQFWKSKFIVSAFLGLSAFTTSVQAVDYYWCFVSEMDYGRFVFYSSAFGVRDSTYDVGIQNDFSSYIDARFNPGHSDGAMCMGPYRSHSEAVRKLNDDIAESRRDGKAVTLTHWSYQGD